MRSLKVCALALTVAAITSGCDKVRNTFGLDHYQADEMNVNPNPPLTTPPNLKLSPPRPGQLNPNAVDAATKAEAVLSGKTPQKGKPKNKSKAENEILKQAAKG